MEKNWGDTPSATLSDISKTKTKHVIKAEENFEVQTVYSIRVIY